ncbi:hypothetical protein CcCBS67573_g08480 [Chytriomyces confervae]|uniref:Uncharacterized protein n=1 Tax=Chytriomyces confervae TaxID=246404 RepID=A0A507EIT5_9FUNG|nr:hypothetical protein CcCBS67573_g08480 [Chytriomyces confervae]
MHRLQLYKSATPNNPTLQQAPSSKSPTTTPATLQLTNYHPPTSTCPSNRDLTVQRTLSATQFAAQSAAHSVPPIPLPLCMDQHLDEQRNRNPTRILNALHMDTATFDGLVQILCTTGCLPKAKYMEHQEQIAIFLFIVGGNNSNRQPQERFQRSTKTVSQSFLGTLQAILHLQPKFMMLPLADCEILPEIALNPKFSPFFDSCIGALDGTHFSACVGETEASPYSSRKGGVLTQNVLGVCGLDMQFQYIHAGWEGSAHDGKVLADALQKGFNIPPGRWYLADAGYAQRLQILVPYHGVRYHLKEWGQTDLRPETKKELFNLRHAQARNVVERIFRCMAKQFPILKCMQSYSLETQRDLAIGFSRTKSAVKPAENGNNAATIYGCYYG